MNAERYMQHVINNIVPSFHAATDTDFHFLDDNARLHRAEALLIAIEPTGIPHFLLPPLCPDLICTKHT